MNGEQQQQQEQSVNPVQAIQSEAKQQELPPKLKKEMQGYKTLLTKLMHSKETRENTMEMLKSGPAAISVPQAALTLNKQAEDIMEKKGIKISQNTKLGGSVFLVTDLIELGNAGAEWEVPVDEPEAQQIFQDTLQDYIEEGLRNKTIDPIELQQQVEPLMTEEQKAVGRQFGEQAGVPAEVTPEQALGNQKGMLQQRGGM